MAFITRQIAAHQALAGLSEAVRLSGLPLELITLREVNLPAWARGLTGRAVKKAGLFLVHLGLVWDVLHVRHGRDAIVREFLLVPTLLLWPFLWFWRDRLWFLVNHNFDSALHSATQRAALRLLAGGGLRVLCFETDAALDALGLNRGDGRTAVIRHPLNAAPVERPRNGEVKPVVGVIGSFRAEKGAAELLQQLTAAARLGVLDARLLLGTGNAAVREEFAAQGWETTDTTTDAAYEAALKRCDVLVLNYARAKYFYRPSGVIADALAAGAVPVAPDYPMIRAQLTQPAKVGATFGSPNELVPAIQEALKLAATRPRAAFLEQFEARRPEQLARDLRQLFTRMPESPFAPPGSPASARDERRPRVDLTRSITVWPAGLKWRRAVWQWLLKPFFMLLPRRASRLRIALLRMMGARIGPGCYLEQRVNVLMPWNLELVDHVAIGRAAEVYNYAPVKIGSMTLLSQHAFLCTGTHDYTHPHMPLTWAPITIGSECWIAADAFIGPGVTIGDGAVIGARSVVTKDMPPWMVCAGNPCRPLKVRELRSAAAAPKPPRS